MSGARLEVEGVSGVICHNLCNKSFLAMLKQYRRLLSSTYGPKGSVILISNAVGRTTLASSSSHMIKQLAFAHPCIKYINALISAQNASCGLAGLYTGIVCIGLLEVALESEEDNDSPHHVIADVAEWIISQVLTIMAQFPSQVVMPLDIGNVEQVTSFVRTILGSKSCINLTKEEKNDLGLNIVKAFLKSIPQEGTASKFGHVNILQATSPGTDARVFDGMLYREPNFNKKLLKKLSLLPKVINILLFAVPLQPGEDTTENVQWRGNNTKEAVYIDKIVPCLLTFIKKGNIHIIANQKSIHPIITFEIERQGYIVLERLGTVATDTLMKLSKCQAITNLSALPQQMQCGVLGKLSSVHHIMLNGKDYLLLQQENNSLSTLLLPSVSPSIEETLKETVESCLAALKMVVVDGKVVAGGGCLETWLAYQVIHMITANMDHLTSVMNVPKYHITRVANGFIQVFMKLALLACGGSLTTKFDWCVDSIFHHLWHAEELTVRHEDISSAIQYKCVCGLVSEEIIKEKHGGTWYEMEFQLTQGMMESSLESHCFCETLNVSEKVNPEVKKQNHSLTCESGSVEDLFLLGIDADSLDEKVSVEEDEDSLEKTGNGLLEGYLEEDGDSLEGQLESLKDDDDMDSLEDVLDGKGEQLQHSKCNHPNITFSAESKNVLYDCYLAKYNAMRLAMEGFSQLFQIGQCVYDP